jgi:formamidopyrimidine-DNA glycosylase
VPELPDVELYLDALRPRVVDRTLERFRLGNPFIVRTIEPAASELEGTPIVDVQRLGKRLVFGFANELYLVLHLMIAGRLRWRERGAPIPGKIGLAALDFPNGTLILTEAGSRRQASIHIVRGADELRRYDPGGIDVFAASLAAFSERLLRDNHTLKRALTDPRIFSGIGNAYSDEILHAARLSPMKLTSALTAHDIETLYHSTRDTLKAWVDRLRSELKGQFPEKVTAFRDEMAVHGKYGKPCPVCASPVQRIVYARNEANYCSRCQTGGRLLSDRALSRLLRDDWPKTLDELEQRRVERTAKSQL